MTIHIFILHIIGLQGKNHQKYENDFFVTELKIFMSYDGNLIDIEDIFVKLFTGSISNKTNFFTISVNLLIIMIFGTRLLVIIRLIVFENTIKFLEKFWRYPFYKKT